MIFKLVINSLYFSIPSFKHYCKCDQNCLEKGQLLCDAYDMRRNRCKFCRLKRCQELAGMMGKWVLSANIPPVENKRMCQIDSSENDTNGKKEAYNKTETTVHSIKYDLSSSQEMIDEMKLRYNNSFLRNNSKVIINKNVLQCTMKNDLLAPSLKRLTHCHFYYYSWFMLLKQQ